MTEGVIVMIAATRKLKEMCMVDGRVDSACMSVEYEAMMIGGSGGNIGSGGAGALVLLFEGW